MDERGDAPSSPLFRISCTEVPQVLLLKSAAKQYFSQFGRIHRLILRPKSRVVIIEYATEKAMQFALARAGEYDGQKFKTARDFKQVVRKKRVKKLDDPDWTLDPDVQAELEAMGRTVGLKKDYELRSMDMQVDAVVPSSKVKLVKQRSKKSLLMKAMAETVKPKKVIKKSWKTSVNEKKLPVEQLELINILKQAATTAEEKFKMLEARDKLIRLRTERHTDLKKAKATVGTCPDMCPEKERLMRETQHQISLFEQETGGKAMNHSLAVKQYSRSSADQEFPLPHELRPARVLRMTMTYLMARIMNLCDSADVNFGDWYHFLWDRTRGIRKDITQQELCSEEAVELVEQCARFHIHCSARLVGEDPSVFDQKINTENLTKCLQTLKYMYHDLELKGVRCRNEAEFRAYIILLNLNDGNFMWEVQQLRPDVQKSPEVRFALATYSAIDKNNYVRFFKLVHATTYLNACILLRYFLQVRLSALKVILKCYSPRQPHKSYPVAELARILAFESAEAAVDFVEYHGLVVTEDRSQVVLDRRLFGLPECPYAPERAVGVIESKRSCSVGEVVSGGRLRVDLYENHVPQVSFDASGRLNVAEIFAELNIILEDGVEEENEREETDGEAPTQNVFAAPISSGEEAQRIFALKPQESSERSKSPMFFERPVETKNLFSPAPTGVFPAAGESIFGKPKIEEKPNMFGVVQPKTFEQFKFVAPEPTEKPIFGLQPPKSEPVKPDVSQILKEKLEKEEQAMRERIEREKEALKKRERELEEKRRQEELIARKRKEEEELRQKRELERKLLEQQQRLKIEQEERRREAEIRAAVAVTMGNLLDSVEESVRRDKLEEIARRAENRKARKYFELWREGVQTRRRKRKAVDYCFAWLMPRSAAEEAEELKTESQSLVLGDIKRYKLGKPAEIAIPKGRMLERIDVHRVCYDSLLRSLCRMDVKFPKELFWKVTISLPDSGEMRGDNLKNLQEVLNGCIGWKGNLLLERKQTANQHVTYCIEKKEGWKACKTDSNAFIFIASSFTDSLQKRIYNTIVHFGQNVLTPVTLILENPALETQKIQLLEEQGLLQTYRILNDKFTSSRLTRLVKESFQFLAQNFDKPPPLELDTLKSFLSQYLAGDIWKRVYGLAKWNDSYRECLKNPEIAIKIYNDNLEKLKEIVFDAERKEFAVFPEVFSECLTFPEYLPCDYKYFPGFWSEEDYESVLRKVLDGFRLPQYPGSWPPEDPSALERDISAYCTAIFHLPEKPFYKLMSVVLKRVDPENSFDDLKHFVWTDLIEAIALEKIAETDFALRGEHSRSVFNQLFVVYNSETLKEYRGCSWFYVNYPPIRDRIRGLVQSTKAGGECKSRKTPEEYSLELDIDLDEMLNKVTRRIVENQERDLRRRKEVQEIKGLMGDLKESIEVQRKINSTLQERLNVALETAD